MIQKKYYVCLQYGEGIILWKLYEILWRWRVMLLYSKTKISICWYGQKYKSYNTKTETKNEMHRKLTNTEWV